MIHIAIIPNGNGAAPEMLGKKVHYAQTMKITGLADGMQSGKPSVAFVFAETSLVLFSAADALKARHGDPRQ